jgi:hypothetical protein
MMRCSCGREALECCKALWQAARRKRLVEAEVEEENIQTWRLKKPAEGAEE